MNRIKICRHLKYAPNDYQMLKCVQDGIFVSDLHIIAKTFLHK